LGSHFIGLVLLTIIGSATVVASGCTAPTVTPSVATEESLETTTSAAQKLSNVIITIIYDNNSYDPRLRTSWGFSCLVELKDTTLLFDTGGDGAMLLSNMSILGLDVQEIDQVVLSHIHGDHTGGLAAILTGGLAAILATGTKPVVYVPSSFPASFKDQVRARTQVVEIRESTTMTEGVYSTGELGSGIIEQSLVLDTVQGLVVITGCAHPGIVHIVTRVREVHDGEIHLVIGGLHLGGKSRGELQDIAASLRRLGVQKLAPCHCTGDEAMRLLAEEWGSDFIANGVGRVIEIAE
jgi:7,8-dihydropterin-6-yl-methyl-4-(beta-D-ribofuranosyl)aminobenzene 5'-phosphate synthase